MTQDEIIEMAQECNLIGMRPHLDGIYSEALIAFANLVAAKALAQPEQEPVALPCCGYADASAIKWNPHNQVVQCHNCGQIYTATPQRTWVGLTDEEITALKHNGERYISSQDFARAVEAKLKQKNGFTEEKNA